MATRTTNHTSRPNYVADPASTARNTGRQVDWDYIGARFTAGAIIVTLNGAAAQGATSLTVDALGAAIPKGALIDFGGAKFARTSAAVAQGATTVPVDATPTALADNDTGAVRGAGAKTIPSGTVMVQLSSGKMVPRAVRPGSETAIGLLIGDATENGPGHATTGYGVYVGGVFYENLLPETPLGTTIKNELNAAGTGFTFNNYADNR